MPDAAVPAVELRDVSASSGGFEILPGTSAAFPEGEFSVVMGVSGSGKSTLLKVAAGLVPADSGTVLLRGKEMAKLSDREELAFRAASGYVFQDSALWADSSILVNVTMPLRIHKPWMSQADMAEAARAVLLRLGYDESIQVRPSELSAGEQKLVSIARAVVHGPSILFMDDPTASLDEDAADKVFDLLAELKADGRTVIVAANSSELAYRFADRLGVVKGGRMEAFGAYDEVVGGAASALLSSVARLRARGGRQRGRPPADTGNGEAGSEMSQRGDV